MDLFETKDLFKKMFPDKLVTFTFDEKCIRQCECVLTEGKPNIYHHVEYNKVKVSIPDMKNQYVNILPHREVMSWVDYKNFIDSRNEVYIHPDQIDAFKQAKQDPFRKVDYQSMLEDFCMQSGMTIEEVENQLN